MAASSDATNDFPRQDEEAALLLQEFESVEFAESLVTQTFKIGLANFAAVPLGFVCGSLKEVGAVCVCGLAAMQLLGGVLAQRQLFASIRDWASKMDSTNSESGVNHRLIALWVGDYDVSMLCSCLPAWHFAGLQTWVVWTLFGLYEYVDPTGDGYQAGRARKDLSAAAKNFTANVWKKDLPHISPWIIPLGLPGVLELLLCLVTSFQVCIWLVNLYQAKSILRKNPSLLAHSEDRSAGNDEARFEEARDRQDFWARLTSAADTCSAVLLSEVFLTIRDSSAETVQEWELRLGWEGQTFLQRPGSHGARFVYKSAIETAPTLWFQVSLLSLSYGTSSNFGVFTNMLSIGSSLLFASLSFADYAKDLPRVLQHRSRPIHKKIVGLLGMVVVLFIIVTTPVRFIGIWTCESRALDIWYGNCIHPSLMN